MAVPSAPAEFVIKQVRQTVVLLRELDKMSRLGAKEKLELQRLDAWLERNHRPAAIPARATPLIDR